MVVRFEPTRVELVETHPECNEILRRTGWMDFFDELKGNNMEVTRLFSQTFDGQQA